MKLADKQALRAKHTCVLRSTSIGCRACDRGVPYPALTVDEIIEALKAGRVQAEAYEKTAPCLSGCHPKEAK